MQHTSYYRVIPVISGEAEMTGLEGGFHGHPSTIQSGLGYTEERLHSFRYSVLKRAIDVVFGITLAILTLPACLAIALAIRFTGSGPIFYREKRIGRYGRPFTIFKFRTMYTPEQLAVMRSIDFTHQDLSNLRTYHKRHSEDMRITSVGRFLRQWSLDELPQLINCIRGDMSLVGPRPVVQAEREAYGGHGDFYDLARPGISGFWQISGRSDISFEARTQLDAQYVREWSLVLDLRILAKTIPVVISKRGAY